MKKCSESAHHALSELNIAPLLDLGFVLLVIFIITTTPVANDREVQLPVGELHLKESPRKPNYITVRSDGTLTVNNTSVEMSNLQPFLALMRQDDPDLSLIIRGDAHAPYRQIRAVLEACRKANVSKVDLATESGEAARPQ